MLQLVAFDVDGVLLDSEPLHYRAKVEILNGFGLRETFDLKQYVGKPNLELWKRVIEENHLRADPAALEKKQFELILNYICTERIPLSRNLRELLDFISEKKIPMAVASSSSRSYVDSILNHFGLTGYFCGSVTGDEVERQKPAPDVYLKLLRERAASASDSIAVEDSEMGIAAASAAGIRCLGYRNPSSGLQNLSEAYRVITDLKQAADYIG